MDEVRELAKILSDYGLTRLTYENNGMCITLERSLPVAIATPQLAATEAAVTHKAELQASGTTVKSPLIGVAYRSREPGAPPLADVGSTVKKGDAICIIEAMKMFSEIPAPCDGTVLEVLFNDGELAEFGAPLFVIGS